MKKFIAIVGCFVLFGCGSSSSRASGGDTEELIACYANGTCDAGYECNTNLNLCEKVDNVGGNGSGTNSSSSSGGSVANIGGSGNGTNTTSVTNTTVTSSTSTCELFNGNPSAINYIDKSSYAMHVIPSNGDDITCTWDDPNFTCDGNVKNSTEEPLKSLKVYSGDCCDSIDVFVNYDNEKIIFVNVHNSQTEYCLDN